MAEYSKEWCDLTKSNLTPDFSVLQIFMSLEGGHFKPVICEGFGFTNIVNEGGDCHVVVNGEQVPFETLKI